MAPLPGVVGHSGLQPHWLVRSKARSLDKAVTSLPLAPPYHAHPVRPSAGTSARRPRSLWPSGDDTGGAAALDPRALGTTGATKPLHRRLDRRMLTQLRGGAAKPVRQRRRAWSCNRSGDQVVTSAPGWGLLGGGNSTPKTDSKNCIPGSRHLQTTSWMISRMTLKTLPPSLRIVQRYLSAGPT